MKNGVKWSIKSCGKVSREDFEFIKACIRDCEGEIVKVTPSVKDRAYYFDFEVPADILSHTCALMKELVDEGMIEIVLGFSNVQ